MTQKLLRLPAVKSLTGFSRSSIYLKISEGSFPKPIFIGKRAVAWIESEVCDWINQTIRNSRTGSKGERDVN
jgi:prophage regulatory protein